MKSRLWKCKISSALVISLFVAGSVPAAIDWSALEAGSAIEISGSETVTDDDFGYLNSCGSITLGTDAILTFDLDVDASLTCPFNASGGKIVKTGSGELELAIESMNGSNNAYRNADLEVQEGTLAAPQVNHSDRTFRANRLFVEEGAVFVTFKPNITEVNELWGAGTVTNRNTYQMQFRVLGPCTTPCVFSGRLTGKGLRWYSSGNITLTGTDSNFNGSFHVHGGAKNNNGKGFSYITKIGQTGGASSIGSSDTIATREGGAHISYLGEGETTDKIYVYFNSYNNNGHHGWDAGATGGIIFTGKWLNGSSNSPRPEHLILYGSNSLPCVISGAWGGDTTNAPTYISKRGTGTWCFANNSGRKNTGAIAVEEGVLQFESIAETNEVCSLGLATCLQSPYNNVYNAAKNVNYAFLLGTDTTEGTMEYIGETVSTCETRPFAINGRGTIRNASFAELRLGQAFAATSSDSTLVLSAPATSVSNVFTQVSDGSAGGKLNVEKRGAGFWMLKGAQTFSGALAVKEGRLVVQNQPYSWFRFTVKETNGGTKVRENDITAIDFNIALQELALYDSSGNRCNTNLTFRKSYTESEAANETNVYPVDWRTLEVNQATWGFDRPYRYYTNRDGDNLLDNKITGVGCCITTYRTLDSNQCIAPRLNNDTTWISFVQRLDSDESLACAFDLVSNTASDHDRTPHSFSFEASSDGIFWFKYCDINNMTPPAEKNHWYSDGTEFAPDQVRPGKGYSFPNNVLSAESVLPNCSSVSVDPDAVLEAQGEVSLKGLSVAVSGNGTIDGFEFAESGELFVTSENSFSSRTDISIDFENCIGTANITKWTLSVNGQETSRYSIGITENGITLSAKGTVLFLR